MFKNKFIYGFLTGILIPALVFGFLFAINMSELQFSFKAPSLILYSLCANALPAMWANKKRWDEYIRGIMIPTVLGCFIWFFYQTS